MTRHKSRPTKRKHTDTEVIHVKRRRLWHYQFRGQVVKYQHQGFMDTGETGHTKRGKHHEAQLIPGVDGHRIFGFPNSIITKLRYCTIVDLSSGAGAVAGNTFAANGIFDPDITGGGHQPLYRDNFGTLYDQYVVIGSKIKVTFAAGTGTLPFIVGITGDDDSTVSGTLETLMEQNNSISTVCGAVGAPPVVLTQTFEPLEMFGVDAKDDGSSATVVSANPTELWTYRIWSIPADLTTAGHCYAKVEIDYTVKFTELSTPVQN